MIRESPKEVIDCVGECCLNIIKGNVRRLTNAQKQHLRSRKHQIRLLSKKKGVPIVFRKKIINQKGGNLLGLQVKPLLALLLGTVLGGLVNHR